jgi:hypothetical protein
MRQAVMIFKSICLPIDDNFSTQFYSMQYRGEVKSKLKMRQMICYRKDHLRWADYAFGPQGAGAGHASMRF